MTLQRTRVPRLRNSLPNPEVLTLSGKKNDLLASWVDGMRIGSGSDQKTDHIGSGCTDSQIQKPVPSGHRIVQSSLATVVWKVDIGSVMSQLQNHILVSSGQCILQSGPPAAVSAVHIGSAAKQVQDHFRVVSG